MEVITTQKKGPCAFRRLLGRCIVSPAGEISDRSSDSNLYCNKIAVGEAGNNQLAKHFFAVKSKVEETGIREILHKL